ncbi:MAG: peptide-methionine (S)-S-oxide reductase, partial [Cyanobacteria bacterium P01_G01_bin.38]
IGYEALLEKFWEIHDPTSLNRQGADRGEQYRSVIFYHTSEQGEIASRSKTALDDSERYSKPIVTQIQPATDYWPATEEHQQYFEKKALRQEHG